MKSRQVFTRRPWVEELESRLVPSTITSYSTNWSGYAVPTGSGAVSSVSGTWTVPAVSGSGTSYAASWVGIDGWSSNSVEQIGTESDLQNGKPVYYAWYEMYPAYPVNLPLTIQPNDTISASVTYSTSTGLFTLSIQDGTESFSVSKGLSSAKRSSAEWIVEAPSSNFGVLPLAPFSPETFSKAQATINGATGPIDHSGNQVEQINMITNYGSALDSTSGLTDTTTASITSSFSVAYSGTTSTPPSGHHGGGGGGGRGGWGGWGWFSTNIVATQLTALEANALGSSSSLMSPSAGPTTNFSLLGPHTTTGVPNGSSFAQNTAILVGGAARTNADVANTNTAPAPEAVMPLVPGDGQQPGQPGTPKADPDAAPMPPVDSDEAAALPGTPAALRQACDACFTQGRWTPAARSEEQVPVLVAPSEGTTTTWEMAVGFLFTLSLGGVWDLARRGDARRQWHLRAPELASGI